METRELVIDANNLYVQGLIKVINDFMLEEASGCCRAESRLKSKIVVALIQKISVLWELHLLSRLAIILAGTALLLYPNYSVKAILKAFCVRIKQIK